MSKTRRSVPWLLAGLFVVMLPAVSQGQLYECVGRGDLTEEELGTIKAIVNDFGFTDIAETWIVKRLEKSNSSSRPELRWILEVDIVRINGDIDTGLENSQNLAREFPKFHRSADSQLAVVQTSMTKVILSSLNAQYETDPAVRAQLIAERDRVFKTEVAGVLESSIQLVNADVDKNPDDEKKMAFRDRWEHYRLKAFQQYSELLPEGSDAAKLWGQKLIEAAEEFVSERFQNFAMQYEAQLILGKAYGRMGRSEDAADALELIIEFEPPVDPPYDEVQVRFTRWLRIQALQATLESLSLAGECEKAVEILDDLVNHPDFPWHMNPEDPELLQFVVAMDIESGIARIGGGVRARGIEEIRTLIDRFDSEAFRRGDPEAAEAFLAETAVGLSQAVRLGAIDMPPEFLYRASVGFKRRGDFDNSIRAAQLALDAGGGVPGEEFWVASSLYEIGESFDSVGMKEAAVAAFQTLSTQYFDRKSDPQFELLLADASQNWFALSGDLAETQGGMWGAMLPHAQEVFAELSRGSSGITLQMQKAAELEGKGRYAQAREIYVSIPRTLEVNGSVERVEQYYRAMAGAGRCLFRAADAAGKAKTAVDAAVTELTGYLSKAKSDGDAAGQAALRFEIASIHADDDVNDRAKGIAILQPLITSVLGKNPYREGGLRLFTTLQITANPDDPADAARPQDAEPALAALKADFTEGFAYAVSLYDLSEAYGNVGTPDAARRAGELILLYMAHPVSKVDQASAGVLLGFAETLIAGGFHKEAAELLTKAKQNVGDNANLKIALVYLYAKAGNVAGKYAEVLASLEEFFAEYETDIIQGTFEEAPYILYQYALAHLGQMKKDRSPKHLEEAFGFLSKAVAIMKQRRSSLLRSGNPVPPRFEKEYWTIFYQWLLVLKEQDQCELVVKQIKTERIMSGHDTFAPPALQEQFNKLERDCQ